MEKEKSEGYKEWKEEFDPSKVPDIEEKSESEDTRTSEEKAQDEYQDAYNEIEFAEDTPDELCEQVIEFEGWD